MCIRDSLGSDLQQRLEPLCLVVLEGGQLIDHHHIEVTGNAAFINEPLDVFPVDDVEDVYKRQEMTLTSSLRFAPVTLYLISMCENLLCFW